MDAFLSDEQLWSLVDRGGEDLDAYLRAHPTDRPRVDALLAANRSLRAAAGAVGSAPARIGGYRIERELGRGGGGVVYAARQANPARRVALKVLRTLDASEPQALARFEREAQALGRLIHPHIATIHEAGRAEDGTPFLAMELVDGAPLTEFARREGLDRRARLELFRDVCDAVQHAHRQGVVHRDLKPSNVLVDRERGVKVVDFGLARLGGSSAELTRDGAVLGTLGYMSPEQARGGEIDERSDVYSLGAMLYELTVEVPAFETRDRTALALLEAVVEAAPVAPRKLDPRIDRDLETVILKALDKDPAQRYPSAAALAEDVACWLAGRPVLARRPGVGRRVGKWIARNKIAFSLSSVAVLLALSLALSVGSRKLFFDWFGADWWTYRSPFDRLRWVGDDPQVELDGRWYELVAIEDLHVDYVLGACKQHYGRWWRDRFAKDLSAILNVMGAWSFLDVDLVLRDLETGEVTRRADVPMSTEKRAAIRKDGFAWPFGPDLESHESDRIRFRGRSWRLRAVDGLRADSLSREQVASFWLLGYDVYCDRLGKSPPDRIRLELVDPSTGDVHVFEDVERAGEREPIDFRRALERR